jgi:hypothetical protein
MLKSLDQQAVRQTVDSNPNNKRAFFICV